MSVVPWCRGCGIPEHGLADEQTTPDLRIIVTCPRCGADTEFQTGGSKYHWQQACLISCTECPWTGAINVELSTVRDSEDRAQTTRINRERRAIDAEHCEAMARTRQLLEAVS